MNTFNHLCNSAFFCLKQYRRWISTNYFLPRVATPRWALQGALGPMWRNVWATRGGKCQLEGTTQTRRTNSENHVLVSHCQRNLKPKMNKNSKRGNVEIEDERSIWIWIDWKLAAKWKKTLQNQETWSSVDETTPAISIYHNAVINKFMIS